MRLNPFAIGRYMKVWVRDKFISITLQRMRGLPKNDALELRDMVGEILTFRTEYLGNPFENISCYESYQKSLSHLFNNSSINDIDINTSLILQDLKSPEKSDLETLSIDVAAAFLKSVANIATFRKKKKKPNPKKMLKYEFFSKLALNAIVEHQTKLETSDHAH